MGPSMSIDGVNENSSRNLRIAKSFNGAVDEHRRSPMGNSFAVQASTMLQWGRR